ncbi:MAG: hypothetical protein ABEJ79_07155 [Halolamina sp.]
MRTDGPPSPRRNPVTVGLVVLSALVLAYSLLVVQQTLLGVLVVGLLAFVRLL